MDRKKIKTIMILILIAAAVILFQHYLMRRNVIPAGVPTSYDTGFAGHKAFYLLLENMGYKVERFKGDTSELRNGRIGFLFLVSPFQNRLNEITAKDLYGWVSEGNRLLIADEGENELFDLLFVKSVAKKNKGKITSEYLKKSAVSKNVKSLNISGNFRFILPPSSDKNEFRTLLEDDGGIICASARVGKGEIVMLSTPCIFNNLSINKNDNAILCANITALGGSDSVAFDETIHSIPEEKHEFTLSGAARLALYQAVFAIIIFYIVSMMRFGKPQKIPDANLRTSSEYIYSLAGLFYRAQAGKYACENLVRGLKRRILKIFGISHDLPEEKVVDLIGSLPDEERKNLLLILKKCEKTENSREISDGELLRLGNEIEKAIRNVKRKAF